MPSRTQVKGCLSVRVSSVSLATKMPSQWDMLVYSATTSMVTRYKFNFLGPVLSLKVSVGTG